MTYLAVTNIGMLKLHTNLNAPTPDIWKVMPLVVNHLDFITGSWLQQLNFSISPSLVSNHRCL